MISVSHNIFPSPSRCPPPPPSFGRRQLYCCIRISTIVHSFENVLFIREKDKQRYTSTTLGHLKVQSQVLCVSVFLSSFFRVFGQIIHYCSYPKPWEDVNKKGDLEMLWWQKFIEMKTSAVSASVSSGGFWFYINLFDCCSNRLAVASVVCHNSKPRNDTTTAVALWYVQGSDSEYLAIISVFILLFSWGMTHVRFFWNHVWFLRNNSRKKCRKHIARKVVSIGISTLWRTYASAGWRAGPNGRIKITFWSPSE